MRHPFRHRFRWRHRVKTHPGPGRALDCPGPERGGARQYAGDGDQHRDGRLGPAGGKDGGKVVGVREERARDAAAPGNSGGGRTGREGGGRAGR